MASIPSRIASHTEPAFAYARTPSFGDRPCPSSPELLVVEEDPQVAALIVATGETAGFSASVTEDFGQQQPRDSSQACTVVLDLELQGLDGVEIIRQLAREHWAGGLILVTGIGERVVLAARTLAEERGLRVIGTLCKPFQQSELRRLLREAGVSSAVALEEPGARVSQVELLQALVGDGLEVYYQPKVSRKTQEVLGMEALVRLRHPSRGLLPPATFIPLAERSGLIDRITDKVCDQAIRDCATWQAAGLSLGVSVNISVLSLHRLWLPDQLLEKVRYHGVPAGQLTVEITESCLAEKPVRALDILTRLRLKGFGLAIDDFGTGYSTMRQLERIPFGELKLDRQFVCGAAGKVGAEAIMASSVDLARRLDMRVVAEGVETLADWDLVSRLRCDEVQGHLIAKPMPGSELISWVRFWSGIPS